MKHLTNTLKAVMLSAPIFFSINAFSQQWFIKPYVGLSNMGDVQGNSDNFNNATDTADVNLDAGFNAGFSGGYRYSANIGVEFGWEYRSNSSETVVGDVTYTDGNYASNTVYLSGLYYLNPYQNWQPYVGAGLIWVEEVDIDLELDGSELSYSSGGDSGYQAFVGVNYQLNSDWQVQFEGRYSSITDLQLSGEGTATGSIANLDYEPLTLQIGMVYQF